MIAAGMTSASAGRRLSSILGPGRTSSLATPGYSIPDSSPVDRIRGQREAELQCLIDPALRAVLEQNEIQLISYGALGRRDVMRDVHAKRP